MKKRKSQSEAMGRGIIAFDRRAVLDWLKPSLDDPFRPCDPLLIISCLARETQLTVLEHSRGRERSRCDMTKRKNTRVLQQAWEV